MNKTWNVNGLGDNLRKLISYYKSNPASEEEIKDAIKKVFTEAGVDDSRFKLFKVSVRGDLAEIEGKDASSYANGLASRIYKVKNREKVINGEKSENGSENMNEKEKAPKKTVSIDVAKLIRKPSAVAQKSALIEVLVDRGIDIYVPVSEATIKNLDIPIDLRQIEGRPLIDGLVDIIKAMSKEYFKNNSQAPVEEQKQESTKELAPEDRNIDGPSDEELKNLGESSNTLQFFVGYDKNKVSRLFQGKEETFEKFEEFVKVYNYLMTLYTTQNLSPDRAKEISNDLLPNYNEVVKECSSLGGEGSRIKGLCEGMMSILDQTYKAENSKDGESLNPSTAKQNIRNMGLTPDEIDGLRNEGITISNKAPEDQTFAGEISDLIGTKNLPDNSDALTKEDLMDMGRFGFTEEDFPTHSAYMEFKGSDEYNLHANNQPTFTNNDSKPY